MKLKTLKDFEKERIILYDNYNMKRKGKIVPTPCDKCGTTGYPLCRFCTPKEEWLSWYKNRTGTDYVSVQELKLIYELKAEAIKWVKHLSKSITASGTYDLWMEEENKDEVNWIMHFFNLTSEDLK